MAEHNPNKGNGRDRFAGGIGLAVAVVVGWALHEYAGADMPEYVISALGGVIMYVVTKVEELSQGNSSPGNGKSGGTRP